MLSAEGDKITFVYPERGPDKGKTYSGKISEVRSDGGVRIDYADDEGEEYYQELLPKQFKKWKVIKYSLSQSGKGMSCPKGKAKCAQNEIINQNGMSLKIECHSKLNVTQAELDLKWNITQNGMSFKMECHSK